MPFPANVCIRLGHQRPRVAVTGATGGDRSVLNSSAVGWHVEFWQTAPVGTMTAGVRIVHEIIHARELRRTPGGKHVVQNARYARFNLPTLLPVPRTKGLMKTDGSSSRRSHPILPDLPFPSTLAPYSFLRAIPGDTPFVKDLRTLSGFSFVWKWDTRERWKGRETESVKDDAVMVLIPSRACRRSLTGRKGLTIVIWNRVTNFSFIRSVKDSLESGGKKDFHILSTPPAYNGFFFLISNRMEKLAFSFG